MKYIYYQSVPDGKIRNFHKAPCEFNEKELEQKVAEYNEKNKLTCNAVVIEVEEGSFVNFLIRKATENQKIKKEILDDLADTLSEASAIVDSLRFGG